MVQLDPKRFDLLCRCISIGNIVLFIARFLVKKVLEKKQELETSDSKAKSFSEFLYRYCKMEGDQSYTNSMKAVSGYLQKRMTCKSILQNTFPNLDAFSAFVFVLNPHTTKKCTGSSSMARETQHAEYSCYYPVDNAE
ncbi:hypothetical protein JHK82_017224 [Glycine max]|nr:hypothetical protein JHK82_017224 [Glycine max]